MAALVQKAKKVTPASRPARKVRSPSRDGGIELTLEGGCAIATLDRPGAHNRISQQMGYALMELAATVEDDEAILAFAITGAGADFCAGFDPDVDSRLVETLALISKPTVAILNGDAYDEGLELALALDLRAAVIDARSALTQFSAAPCPISAELSGCHG